MDSEDQIKVWLKKLEQESWQRRNHTILETVKDKIDLDFCNFG